MNDANLFRDGIQTIKSGIAVSCPGCAATFRAPADESDDFLIHCDRCGKEFTLREALPLLDMIPRVMLRMIVGMFVFFCRRVPAWCHDRLVYVLQRIANFFHWLVPFSWKLVRVVGWVTLWLLILIGPPVAFGDAALHARSLASPPPGNRLSGFFWAMACVSFLSVAAGYIWAFRHYRLKKGKSKCGAFRSACAKIRDAVELKRFPPMVKERCR